MKKYELPTAFLKKCKLCRELAGMTLEDMAEICGTTRQHIYVFEKGGSNNGYFVLCYLRTFDLSDYLYGGVKHAVIDRG